VHYIQRAQQIALHAGAYRKGIHQKAPATVTTLMSTRSLPAPA